MVFLGFRPYEVERFLGLAFYLVGPIYLKKRHSMGLIFESPLTFKLSYIRVCSYLVLILAM